MKRRCLLWGCIVMMHTLLGVSLDAKHTAQSVVSSQETVEQRVETQRQELLASPLGSHWKSWGFTPKNGVVISLTGIHTESSCGIGEYTDLLPFISWCKEVGFDLIQLLPVNDSYQSPFSLISSCALSTRYLGLHALPEVENFPELVDFMEALSTHNNDLRVDISWIDEKKHTFLTQYYEKMGHRIRQDLEYQAFVQDNRDWLIDYALYKSIAQKTSQVVPLEKWKREYKDLKTNREGLLKEFAESIEYYQVLQYLCFRQMAKVKERADALGVLLMADITFAVSKNSADVYAHPEYFLQDVSLGAMPDLFAKKGQNWNLPVYNFEKMHQEGYSWWKRRLELVQKHFSCYRLDHALGFYRQWAIPEGKKAVDGYLIPESPEKQVELGHQMLCDVLRSIQAFPVAETFGGEEKELILEDIEQLGIPSIKVLWWERTPAPEYDYISSDQFPIATALALSLHDSEIFAESWSNNTDLFFGYSEFRDWKPMRSLSEERLYLTLREIAVSSAVLRISPLQEFLWMTPTTSHFKSHEERINIPGTVSPWNWSLRYIPSVEELMKNKELNTIILSINTGKKISMIH